MTERPVAEMTYEQARDELVQVVSRLEAGAETLEGSLALWERGEELAARCQQWLDGARDRLAAARRTGATAAGATPGSAAAGSAPGADGTPATAPDDDLALDVEDDVDGLDLDEEDQR